MGKNLNQNTIITSAAAISSSEVVASVRDLTGTIIDGGLELTISSGVSSVDVQILDGTQFVLSGGVDINCRITGQGRQYVVGGLVSGAQLLPLLQAVEPDVTSSGNTIIYHATNYAEQYVSAGGIANNCIIMQNVAATQDMDIIELTVGSSTQYVLDGGVVNNTEIVGATQYISSGGVANSTNISGVTGRIARWTAKQYVYDGGLANATSLTDGAEQYIYLGGIASDVTLAQSGFSFVEDGGIIAGDIHILSGGYLSVGTGGLINGDVALNVGGSMTIGLSNGGTVDLLGDHNKGLVISGYVPGQNDNVTTKILGLSSDSYNQVTIDGLKGANVSSVTYPDADHITLQLLDGTSLTLNMIGIQQSGYTLGSDASGNLTMIVCFLSGTLIRMVDGDCAVEDIQVGDVVLTYDAQTKKKVSKKITWVGKQTARVNPTLPDDQAGYPVRILKDTFKKGVPSKDLLITPEHCLFIDGYFIPARMLVNGRSIYYDYSMTSYEYYHVETEDHSVIWADNMLTESYLNTGNRHQFNRDEKVVTLDRQVKDWEHDAAAPLMVTRSVIEPVFNRLSKRANRQKLPLRNDHEIILSYDHGLYLLTENGEEIYQSRTDQDQVIFTLPANTQNVYLVSKKSRPCDVVGPFVDDRRSLGVLVGKVSVLNQYGAYPMAQYLQTEELQGWSVVEESFCRWTMGCALLPLDVYNADYSFEISIQIISAGPYFVKQETNEEEEEKIAV